MILFTFAQSSGEEGELDSLKSSPVAAGWARRRRCFIDALVTTTRLKALAGGVS